MEPRLILWDVDWTLVDSAGLGRDAFYEAFEVVTGRPPAGDVPFAGRTDLEIAHDMLAAIGVDDPERLLERFHDALAEAMTARAGDLRTRGSALPGVPEALERLDREPDVIQSLLTGNIAPNAVTKLAAHGLDRYVDFESGAYGSDHRVRGELVAIARRRAERRHGVELRAERVVLIGDTPLDVAAALEGRARAVGVASGPYDRAALEDAGAHAVLDDLRDFDALLAALG